MAELLLVGKSKPREAQLRRAQSSLYYAAFHCLGELCANALIGKLRLGENRAAWNQTYRALEHKKCKDACRNGAMISKFPQAIRDFANVFVVLQTKRHAADYDPHHRLTKSEVLADIELADSVIKDLTAVSLKDRRAFAAYILLKKRDS